MDKSFNYNNAIRTRIELIKSEMEEFEFDKNKIW